MHLKRALTAGFASLGLIGCEATKALTFQPAANSGVIKDQRAQLLYFHEDAQAVESFERTPIGMIASEGLRAALEQCIPPRREEAIPLLLIPVAAAGAQFAFGLLTDQLAGIVADVRKRAKAESKAQVTVPTAVLQADGKWECLLFTRSTVPFGSETPTEVGLALVLRKVTRGSGVALLPTYLEVNNAKAETGASPSPSINLAAAIVVTSLATASSSPGATVSQTTSITFTFGDVQLGSVPVNCSGGLEGCGRESVILAPVSNALPGATIAVSVVETGSAFADPDPAKAELDALKAALGPAIAASVTTGLGSLDD
jgi:hypothetical protein